MHHMTKVPPGSCSPFETPKHVPQFSFLLASSHHHPSMNYHYIFLLLLVVLSAYSESPQHADPPDSPPIEVTVYPDSSSAQLGILAPVLPQNEVYTWSLSENQASVHFRCKLMALVLKKSLFRKHDFAACVHRLYHCNQNLCFQHLQIFSAYRNGFHAQIREEHSNISNQFHFYGGGKALIFSSDELLPYALTNLHEQQYQFLQCVKKDNKQSIVLNDGDILCSVPLNILTPKLTLKTAKKLAPLHNMYMPSKILLKMHRYYLKITDAMLVMTFWPYSNLIKLLLMLNVRKHGIRKTQRNML